MIFSSIIKVAQQKSTALHFVIQQKSTARTKMVKAISYFTILVIFDKYKHFLTDITL